MEKGNYESKDSRGSFVVDNSSLLGMILTVLFLVAFIVLRISTSVFKINGLQSRTEYFQLNNTNKMNSLNIDLKLSNLEPMNGQISLFVKALSPNDNKNVTYQIVYVPVFYYNGSIVQSGRAKSGFFTFNFHKGKKRSLSVLAVRENCTEVFDEVKICISLTETERSNIEKLIFTWRFKNESTGNDTRVSRLSFIAMILYSVGTFIYYSQFAKNLIIQTLCSVLGIIALICSIPISLTVRDLETAQSIRCCTTALLVSLYRFICMYAAGTSSGIEAKFEKPMIFVFASFYVYKFLLSVVYYRGNDVALNLEMFVLVSHICEAFCFVLILVTAVIKRKASRSKRFIYFALMITINLILEFSYENGYACNRRLVMSHVETELWSSIHIVFVSFLLFYMQISVDENYAPISLKKEYVSDLADAASFQEDYSESIDIESIGNPLSSTDTEERKTEENEGTKKNTEKNEVRDKDAFKDFEIDKIEFVDQSEDAECECSERTS